MRIFRKNLFPNCYENRIADSNTYVFDDDEPLPPINGDLVTVPGLGDENHKTNTGFNPL